MPLINCKACKLEISIDESIRCDFCKDPFHSTCTGLSRLDLNNLKSKKLIFYCDNCAHKDKYNGDLVSAIEELKLEINTLKQNINSGLIDELKLEISTLKQNIAVDSNVNSSIDFEKVIAEICERDKRKHNLIIYGVAEPSDKDSNLRSQSDKVVVSEFIKLADADIDISGINPIRLGKYNADKIRPIKIRLLDTKQVHSVIHGAKKLNINSNNSLKGLKVSLDRTPQQISYFKNIKSDLDLRISQGEKDLVIKHVQGIPKIVSLNM